MPEDLQEVNDFLTFHQLLDNYPAEITGLETLPVCHTTTWGAFNNIAVNKVMANSAVCDVYGQRLIYFFYGKASYVVKGTNNPVISDEAPITFIFDLSDIEAGIHRLLPFDSGAYDRLGVSKGFTKEDFTYYFPTEAIVKKLVKIMHDINDNYFKTALSSHIISKYKQLCRPLNELIRLHEKSKHSSDLNYGGQAFTFELQFLDDDIKFKPLIIVLPYNYFDDEEVREVIGKTYLQRGIKIAYYNDEDTMIQGSDSYANMKRKVIELIKAK